DPAEAELTVPDQPKLAAEARASEAGQRRCSFALAVRREEQRVARLHRGLLCQRRLRRLGNEFGDRALAHQLAAFFFEQDVAEARRAFAARPFVQLVEERTRLRCGARRRNGAYGLVFERLERDVVAREHLT